MAAKVVLQTLGAVALRLPTLVRRRRYARLIRASGLFDAEHYLRQVPDSRAARVDPVWHYLVEGAAAGLDPNPLFDTSYYVERCPESGALGKNPLVHFIRSGGASGLNPSPRFDARHYLDRYPDVRRGGMNPLAHYLARGEREGRLPLPPEPAPEAARPAELDPSAAVPFGFAAPHALAPPSLAVACHLFHAELAGEFRRYLANVPFRFDLFVTTDTASKRDALERCFRRGQRGALSVRVVENRGRDVAPKLVALRDIYETHEYVLHLHSKRSDHEPDLAAWRSYLLETLLGSPAVVASVFEAFYRERRLGMIGAQHFEPTRRFVGWGENLPPARRLAARAGLALDDRTALEFPSGSMFWARSAALEPLLDLRLSVEDFEPERGQTDGTTAHAIERLYYLACERSGHAWIKIARPELCPGTPRIQPIDSPEDLRRFLAECAIPLSAPGAPAPRKAPPPPSPTPAVLARLVQARALGLGCAAAHELAVAIGAAGASEGEVARTRESAMTALRRAGHPDPERRIRVGPDAGAVVTEGFARGATLCVAAEAGALLEPDALASLGRMAAAHEDLVLLEPLSHPFADGKAYSPFTFDTPAASGACVAIPRVAFEAMGSPGTARRVRELAVELSGRAREAAVPVRVCPAAMLLDAPERTVATTSTASVQTIVRFHDVERLDELRRCVFSLVGQRHRPLDVLVALQRFTRDEVARTRDALAPLFDGPSAPGLRLLDYEDAEPRDARSQLLNMGLRAASARFVAFLDYDDLLHPGAYAQLVDRAVRSGAAIAFASVRIVRVDVHERFQYARSFEPRPFAGEGLRDLFRSNFCPIHSYLIDRERVPPDVLRFDTSLAWEEDYDLLLRVCARFPSDFSLVGTHVGDYVYKNDGSNTVPTGKMSVERARAYDRVLERMEALRRSTEVSLEVQRSLGIRRPARGLTIREVLSATESGGRVRRSS